jgi:hypothetical protein
MYFSGINVEHITQIKAVFRMQNNQDKANQMEQMSNVKTVFLPWPQFKTVH